MKPLYTQREKQARLAFINSLLTLLSGIPGHRRINQATTEMLQTVTGNTCIWYPRSGFLVLHYKLDKSTKALSLATSGNFGSLRNCLHQEKQITTKNRSLFQ